MGGMRVSELVEVVRVCIRGRGVLTATITGSSRNPIPDVSSNKSYKTLQRLYDNIVGARACVRCDVVSNSCSQWYTMQMGKARDVLVSSYVCE